MSFNANGEAHQQAQRLLIGPSMEKHHGSPSCIAGLGALRQRSEGNEAMRREAWTRTLEEQSSMRWQVAEPVVDAQQLATALDVAPLVAQVLCRRGHKELEAARAFLSPKLTGLSDPRELSGCQQAAERLASALRASDTVAIYGDYDVDGVTATAILYNVIKHAAPSTKVLRYIPHRLEEGYGLNEGAIIKLSEAGAKVIVTVDCGVTALSPAEVARERGIDLIITDHHEVRHDGELPRAHSIVHPNLTGESDPTSNVQDLCGAGIAYKLAWQLARELCGSERVTPDLREILLDLLPLAALGTIADVVPLVDENRIIATYGLRRIKGTRLVGLNALIDAASLRGEDIDAYHVGFVIGPRLNACGRMGHAREAVSLLTDASPDVASRIASDLNTANERRRATERGIFEEARSMVVESGYDHDDVRTIVLGHEGWHQGVVGIVCSRLVETFGRPTVLFSLSDDVASGSARSIDGFNLMEALGACQKHLVSYGGHAMAAGLKIMTPRLESFRDAMIRFAAKRLSPEDLKPTLDIDASVELPDLTHEACTQLERLAPFGRSNPAPLVEVRHVRVIDGVKAMGQGGRHLSLTITQGGRRIRCIGWRMGELAGDIRNDMRLDVVGEPKINRFRGRSDVELEIKDVKLA